MVCCEVESLQGYCSALPFANLSIKMQTVATKHFSRKNDKGREVQELYIPWPIQSLLLLDELG